MVANSATVAEAAAELLARRRARTNLHDFCCYINPDFITSPFSRALCSALDQFAADLEAGRRPVLVVQAPPQHGKSEIVSRNLPAYLFGRWPHLSIGGLSYGKDLAADMNRDVQRIMMGEEYARLFPATSLNSRRVVTMDIEAKRNSDTFEIVGHRGRYIAQGVGGVITGKRLDVGIIDDPIKNAQEALSSTTKDGLWAWYGTTFLTRLSRDSGQVIMATRWALDDLSGRVLANNPHARLLSFPAIDDHGRALVPDLHPIEKLLETKNTMPEYFWSAMYQQSPTAVGGNLIKSEWWQFYKALPRIRYRLIFGDTALKDKQRNDYSVLQCWGYTHDRRCVLIDQIRDKWQAPELLIHARAFWDKHKAVRGDGLGTLRGMRIEDKASGTGLIQTLQREGIPADGIQRSTDKVARANDAAPSIKSGLVMLPHAAPWLSDYLTEWEQFPAGAHDDQIDPTIDAIMEIVQPGGMDYAALSRL